MHSRRQTRGRCADIRLQALGLHKLSAPLSTPHGGPLSGERSVCSFVMMGSLHERATTDATVVIRTKCR